MPAPAVAPFPAPAAAADPEARPRAQLIPGRWYAAAIDTSPIPVALALDTIEERLTQDLQIGTLRLYQDGAQLPIEVPGRVRTAPANVWATGQYLGPGGDAPMPAQVIELAEWTPPGAAPITPRPSPTPAPAPAPKPKPQQVSTMTLVAVGVGAVALLGGGVALLMWLRKKKKRKNGKRRR